jgi:hypothetical protein
MLQTCIEFNLLNSIHVIAHATNFDLGIYS